MEHTYLDCLALFGVGGAHPGGLHLTKNILSEEKIDETTKILDAGCGTGQTSAYMAKQYQCDITALDFSQIMLEKASKRFTDLQLPVTLKQGSTENLPFDDETFDIVLSESVIAFTNILLSLSEFKRVLKPNGKLLAIEMVLDQSASEEKLNSIKEFYGFSNMMTEDEWYQLFRTAGFKEISVKRFELDREIQNLDDATDFSISEYIDEPFYEILERHFHYSTTYKEILGYRVFKCLV
ncbi:class I SAM-dependent methyltransferase [Bacillus sp. S/N-304-OC-R1]|uniref:class I SAM-dependent methyltransferase n=1 Tax=Bacillus sp. S/N-304-OC-R1 TaxID=2758034 RepID=UPI001C8E75BA|nr:class I SAM-dependent methyltransferase [Bacillus sp. S/N-304-OC-R1]MBY0123752.1 methyltransferase domain-containing protein [Bacillus sp. S/N-304-OC-R1]